MKGNEGRLKAGQCILDDLADATLDHSDTDIDTLSLHTNTRNPAFLRQCLLHHESAQRLLQTKDDAGPAQLPAADYEGAMGLRHCYCHLGRLTENVWRDRHGSEGERGTQEVTKQPREQDGRSEDLRCEDGRQTPATSSRETPPSAGSRKREQKTSVGRQVSNSSTPTSTRTPASPRRKHVKHQAQPTVAQDAVCSGKHRQPRERVCPPGTRAQGRYVSPVKPPTVVSRQSLIAAVQRAAGLKGYGRAAA